MAGKFMRSCLVSVVLMLPVYLAAQDGDTGLGDLETGVRDLYDVIGRIMMIVMGIGGLVVLVMIILRMMNGDRESATKLAWWLLGLAFGFAMISFFVN